MTSGKNQNLQEKMQGANRVRRDAARRTNRRGREGGVKGKVEGTEWREMKMAGEREKGEVKKEVDKRKEGRGKRMRER